MSITSLSFAAFFFVLFFVYYLVPKRWQWIILLIGSLFFYAASGLQYSVYILFTSLSIYSATQWIYRRSQKTDAFLKEQKKTLNKEERAKIKKQTKQKNKAIMVVALLLNIGILCFFKYSHFVLEQFSALLGLFGKAPFEDRLSFVIPLGISFYTFQSIGYLVEVYWGRCVPEKNYFKVLLFVSFFPQITQGPISDFSALSKELYSEHSFSYKNFSWGTQRVVWGLAKKLLLADIFGIYVSDVFHNYAQYTGITVFLGALMYSVQIYADFSGYMDIVCGLCEMLGITLTENFERPYFSKSVAEYWRRWHITLGAWFKKYIYYPIGVSAWNRSLSKRSRKRFGKHFSDSLSPTIALIVTWLATGLWHGASWTYIVWGLLNGFFIILSIWMEPVYTSLKGKLRIKEATWSWRFFQTIRTFLLVTLIKVFPEVGSFSDGVYFLKRLFSNHSIPRSFSQLAPFITQKLPFFVASAVLLILFVFSLHERKQPIRVHFNRIPFLVRIVLLAFVVVIIGIFADLSAGGFMYARF